MMKCDYDALASYLVLLDEAFKCLKNVFSDVETCNGVILKSSNWDAPTRGYYLNEVKFLTDTFNTIEGYFDDIVNYLSNVINNYYIADMNLGKAITGD